MPFPKPLPPAVMVTQEALLVAVQLQPMPAVTLTLPLLALDATDALEAEIEYVQGSAGWLTVKICPPMVKDPDLQSMPLLAAIE